MRKNPWNNPEYRKKMLKKRKETAKRPEVQAKKRRTMLRLYREQPEIKTKQSISQKRRWSKVSVKKRQQLSKKLSVSTTEQMHRQWADPKWRRKMVKTRKVQGQKPENKKKLSIAGKKVWKRKSYRKKTLATRQRTMYTNPEWLKKVAEAGFQKGKPSWNAGFTKYTHPSLMKISKKLEGRVPTYGRKEYWYYGNGKRIAMRSTWEVAYAHWLDEQKIRWKYESKDFYLGKGNWTGENYRPDFFLPKETRYVEIKGYYSPVNKLKMAEFRKKFKDVKLEILDRKKLKKLGVF